MFMAAQSLFSGSLSTALANPRCTSHLRPLFTIPKRHASRATTPPKATLDIKSIAKSPGLYEENCKDRNYPLVAHNSWQILENTTRRAELQKHARTQREENNHLLREIAVLRQVARKSAPSKKQNLRLDSLIARASEIKNDLKKVVEEEDELERQIQSLALPLPNLSSQHTPNGANAEVVEIVEPKIEEMRYHSGKENCLNASATSHVDIGLELDLLDFEGAAQTSGWGFYMLKNDAAMLEQALIQYALSVVRSRGFDIVSPPSLVWSYIATACGFTPRDQNNEQQIYAIRQANKDEKSGKPGLALAATAEIPLAGMYANHTFTEAQLPLRHAAVSRCYRAEAGARGADTKGLYRVHEFTKVEMFAWTAPPTSSEAVFDTTQQPSSPADDEMFNLMLAIQREILTSLDLTFRVLEMPATDLGAPASRKRDIEVYFPSRAQINDGWGEVTSTSLCTDYQSRRLDAKLKLYSGGIAWPHTLNGTALAVPRVLAAILETGWDEKSRRVRVPEALRRWMGVDWIEKRKQSAP